MGGSFKTIAAGILNGRFMCDRRLVAAFAWLLLITPVCFVPAYSQTESVLTAEVTDQNGAQISKVSARLRNADGVVLKQINDFAPPLFFRDLAPGEYSLEISSEGFKTQVQKIKVNRKNIRITFRLGIKEIVEEVKIKEERATIGGALIDDFTQEEIDNLPDDPREIEKELRRRYGDDIVIRVDGFEGASVPQKDRIASIRVIKSSFDAEFHAIGKTIVDIRTKAGAKSFFASVSLNYNNSRFNARNSFSDRKLPTQDFSSFGLFIFPAIKEKLNFGFDYFVLDSKRTRTINTSQSVSDSSDNEAISSTKSFSPTVRATYNVNETHTLNLHYEHRRNKHSNIGIGGLNLKERAYSRSGTSHRLRISEYGLIGEKNANQFRMQVFKDANSSRSELDAPAINVNGAFRGGGAGIDNDFKSSGLEIADNFLFDYGKHHLKIGGLFEFSSLRIRSRNNLNGRFVFANLEDYKNGEPYSFSLRRRPISVRSDQLQFGLFLQDDLRLNRQFQISAGVRYEWQNNLADHNNFSPRFAVSWAPREDGKIVLKSGVGVFYHWLENRDSLTLLGRNENAENYFIIYEPSYPYSVGDELPTNLAPPSIYRKHSELKTPYTFFTQTGIRLRLSESVKFNAEYSFNRAFNMFRSRDVNAPFNRVRPDQNFTRITQVESTGNLVRHVLKTSVQGTLAGASYSLNYVLSKSESDFDGIFALPTDSHNTGRDWGPTSFDRRHKIGGDFGFDIWKKISGNLGFELHSPEPYSLLTGVDDNGDGVLNDRPEGVGKNSLRGSWFRNVDLRLSRSFQIRERSTGKKSVFGLMGQRMLVSVSIRNLLNSTNPQGYIGIQNSPLFGKPIYAYRARSIRFGITYSF